MDITEDICADNRSRSVEFISAAQALRLAERVMRNPNWRARAVKQLIRELNIMSRLELVDMGECERGFCSDVREVQEIARDVYGYWDLDAAQRGRVREIMMGIPRLREEMMGMVLRECRVRREDACRRDRRRERRERRRGREGRRGRVYRDDEEESEGRVPPFIYQPSTGLSVDPSGNNHSPDGGILSSLLERTPTPTGSVCYPPSPRIPVSHQHYQSEHPERQ
jgi:hypothetical protein